MTKDAGVPNISAFTKQGRKEYMPQPIDLTQAYGMRRFEKAKPKRVSLFGALVVSNIFWITMVAILGATIMGLSKVSSSMAQNFIKSQWEISHIKQLTAKELAERDSRIARLIAYQSASPLDVVKLGKKVSSILESASPSQRLFIERALPEAMMIQITHNIPASAVLAMAIYESGYGQSTLASKYNNYFGIKAFDDWKGSRARSMPTRDLGVLTSADFRAYKDLKDGFEGYAEFLRENARYQKAFRTKTGTQFVDTILKAGYCPDSNYLANIEKIMSRHQLRELDDTLDETTGNRMQVASYRE